MKEMATTSNLSDRVAVLKVFQANSARSLQPFRSLYEGMIVCLEIYSNYL